MKRVSNVLELPLIAIDEGVECGKIKELLVNPESGKVEYLIIEDGQWYLGAKLLSFDKIMGLGIDAVTARTRSDIKNFREVEGAIKLAEKNVKIIGAKCFTQKGKFIGLVNEYLIDEDDGMIIACELDVQGVLKLMPSSSILTYGKDVLILEDNVEENLECDIEAGDCKVENSQKAVSGDEYNLVASSAVGSGVASKLFEQRQIQFLLGKKASKRIVDAQGNVLIDEGQLVTEEIVDRIKACGKLVELTMNINP